MLPAGLTLKFLHCFLYLAHKGVRKVRFLTNLRRSWLAWIRVLKDQWAASPRASSRRLSLAPRRTTSPLCHVAPSVHSCLDLMLSDLREGFV